MDYWFTIEPYVYFNVVNGKSLLYNTLDGAVIESDSIEVALLLQKIRIKENCGVVKLSNECSQKGDLKEFISEVRKKYMGDLIAVNLSKWKPVQVMPIFNYISNNTVELYKKHSITPYKNILNNLTDIYIHLNKNVDIEYLVLFLQSLPENLIINIIGNFDSVPKLDFLWDFLNASSAPKNIICSLEEFVLLNPVYKRNFYYRILVDNFVDVKLFNTSVLYLSQQLLSFEYIFNVTSIEECNKAEEIISQYGIQNCCINPIYTGENILFFEKYVYLSKEDILSTKISVKDIFSNQSINVYDFGKIHIMPNGDAYANVNHPILGNIYIDSIYEIVQKELDEGKSWFRIRNEAPCHNCLYQWLCPSPSDCEIQIGRSNLCFIK